MTLQEFANVYNHRTVGNGQCPALVNRYMLDVLGIEPGFFGDAHNYYDEYEDSAFLRENFIKIPVGTKRLEPGDIVVWNTNVAPPYGHVDICYEDVTTTSFTSFSQNWGTPLECSFVVHNYTNVLGYLRFRNVPGDYSLKNKGFKWVLYTNKINNKRKGVW